MIGLSLPIAVLITVATIVLLRGSGVAPSATPTKAPPTATSAPRLTAAQAHDLSAAITSGDPARLHQAIDAPPGQPLDPAAVNALRAFGGLTFDLTTFHDNADGTATITATSGHPQQRWQVLLVTKAGRWLIAQTDPLP